MEPTPGGGVLVHAHLSERNLRALLQKLTMDGSARTIFTQDDVPGGVTFAVTSEANDRHYGEREFPPGVMHPLTEAEIA